MRISIVITNYNYGRFLREAIDSALAVQWPDKQIIVCDDGSTDQSSDVIRSYGNRIEAVFKKNGGQSDSANFIFPQITGEIVFFLDSDDALLPEAAEEVAKVWTKDVAKVQFPMMMMRENGEPTGSVYPNFTQQATIKSGYVGPYLSSPTSGNAWSYHLLKAVLPLPVQYGNKKQLNGAFDGYLSTLAPLVGDVISLSQPLARYRINTSNAWTTRFSVEMVADNCDEDLARTALVNEKAKSLGFAGTYARLDDDDTHLMKRLVYMRYLKRRYKSLPNRENRIKLIKKSLHAVRKNARTGTKTKALLAAWFLAVGYLPKRLALPIIKMRFVPSYRPAIVNRLLVISGWRRNV